MRRPGRRWKIGSRRSAVQPQESVAGIPGLSDTKSNNDRELANQDQVNIGRRRRRGADDGEQCGAAENGDTEHGRNDQLPRKRRRTATLGTAPKPQARLQCASSRSPQAQRPPIQPKPRQRLPALESPATQVTSKEDFLDKAGPSFRSGFRG
ncbi:hypothetical protein N657DRAFT_257285 [Parathielavia appendiculata]|uniref:Uncharacterized protein n=1 Tax=Parathielavia appendiculata TaxID=2587402 RepID=A0AAN6YZF4_9PEZI|nr:hypothetical protein N657DRAFT_257285 [Parathielavia appendiculata]